MACLATALVGIVFAPLSGCGGGVGEEGTGYASGSITGFGSIIVNGIEFDDAAAQVEDGDGASRQRAELRLGMTVEVNSGVIQGGAARATRVRFDNAITGPVERLESDGFVVLGQRVVVDETTVYDLALAAGLRAVAVGQTVEVYGFYDAGLGRFRATRVDRRLLPPLLYRLRGVVSDLDERTHTLRIGTALFAYGSASAVPSDLAVGSFVRLFVATTPDAFGRWTVLRFGQAQRALADNERVSIKGFITQFGSVAAFRVDGWPVDASAGTVSGTLAVGARVEVTGSVRGGALVAERVEVRSDQSERDRGFELRGAIESVAADRTSLVLRGVTVGLSRSDLVYDNGTAADLVAGRQVEVRGFVSLANGARLDAVQVKFR